MTTIEHNLPWVDSPFFKPELEASDLSDNDKAFVKNFADNGYVIIDEAIDNESIDKVVNELDSRFGEIQQGVENSLRDAWKYNNHVKQIAINEAILSKLRLLYRREPIPVQTLNLKVSTQIRSHSDMIHLNSMPQRFMCGVWIAFEDCVPDNGPLYYYPKSHKLPFYDMIDVGVKASETVKMKKEMMAFAENYEVFIEGMIQALNLEKKILNIKKGQAIIWAANLLHGAEQIKREGSTRLSQVSHYHFEDCMYYIPRLSDIAINKIYLNDITNIKTGKKVPNNYLGEKVHTPTKLYLERQTIKSLKKISHLLPKSLMTKIKAAIK